MIVRPLTTQIANANPAVRATSVPSRGMPGETNSRVRLNLRIKRLNVEGLAPSEQGVFLSAFQLRLNTLVRAAVPGEPWSRLVQRKNAAAIRRVDGGSTPSRMDAKSMGERAAAAVVRELLR
jgi:hypothetical protein